MTLHKKIQIKKWEKGVILKAGIICVKSSDSRAFPSTNS